MFACLLAGAVLTTSPVAQFDRSVDGISVRVIQVNFNEPNVRVGVILANGFPGSAENFADIVKREKPFAAVNGAYFDKDTKLPIGDIAVDGKTVHSGRMGTVFTITPERSLDIHRVIRHRTYAWGSYQLALGCGPALLLDGKKDVQVELEGFRDPHVIGRTQRMGIGYTKGGKILLVHVRKAVTFDEMATVFEKLGCFEAMNLDAGASLAMYYDRKTLQPAGRQLTNLIGVWIR